MAAEADDIAHVAVGDIPLAGVEVLGLENQFPLFAVAATCSRFWIVPEDAAAVVTYHNLAEQGLDSVLVLRGEIVGFCFERGFPSKPSAFHFVI